MPILTPLLCKMWEVLNSVYLFFLWQLFALILPNIDYLVESVDEEDYTQNSQSFVCVRRSFRAANCMKYWFKERTIKHFYGNKSKPKSQWRAINKRVRSWWWKGLFNFVAVAQLNEMQWDCQLLQVREFRGMKLVCPRWASASLWSTTCKLGRGSGLVWAWAKTLNTNWVFSRTEEEYVCKMLKARRCF